MLKNKKLDLRSALTILKKFDKELVYTNEPVDPIAELTGIYRYIGAYGTIKRPTKVGPAMIFRKIKGYDNISVLIGLLSSRERIAKLFNTTSKDLAFMLKKSLTNPIKPILLSKKKKANCQEIIHMAHNPDFDILKILPIPTVTPEDAGPYITMGMCYASDPDTNDYDISIHRLCVQSKNTLSMYFVESRHLDQFRKKSEILGKPLPISINIGVDPAIEISASFEPPITPLGFNELSIAGSLRNKAVELTKCITINTHAIANAEIVIEGELIPHIRIREDQNTNSGKAMPEFSGYSGNAEIEIPVIKINAITHRRNPILQTCIAPSDEHTNMTGLPTEASILEMTERSLPGFVINVHCPSPGGGKYLAILQIKKKSQSDEGRQRQAALLAFSVLSELKHIILIDEDVDIFDINDVIWAMTTRYQGDISTIFIPGVRCHPLDPSSNPEFNPFIRNKGISCKTIFDCTVPFHLKSKFQRSTFLEVNIDRFVKNFKKK